MDTINPIIIKSITIGTLALVFGANKKINNKNNGNNAHKQLIGKKQEILFKYSIQKILIFTELLLIVKLIIVESAEIVGIIKIIKPNIAK